MTKAGGLAGAAAFLFLAGTARADEPTPPTPPVEPTAPPAAEPAVAPEAPEPARAPVAAIPAETPAAEVESGRPEGLTVAIGAGFLLPGALDTATTASVRLRLASGLTLEPRIDLHVTSSSIEAASGLTAEDTLTVIELSTLLRYPLASRGRLDFVGLGGAGVGFDSQNPEGNDNDRTDIVVDLLYGLAIEYWFSAHWCMSLTATNPIASYTSTEQAQGPGATTTTTNWTVGAFFEPLTSLTLHLYY